MATGLLLLLDDIASILDDVAVLTKVSVQKTAGVLGDDLALNAHQVSGVAPNRELPIVWAVAKGSFVNKAILVPGALVLSSWASWSITPLMVAGGTFLCFEGFEKIAHRFLHGKHEDDEHHAKHLEILSTVEIDVAAAEKEKVRGAIRTDFILSAEIIVISLGIVEKASFSKRLMALVAIGILMTVGVYGLVAAIVKLDDLGLYLTTKRQAAMQRLGRFILNSAPYLMRFLTVAGTVAMFLVGGGLLVHNIDFLHAPVEHIAHLAAKAPIMSSIAETLAGMLLETFVGLVAGAVVVAIVTVIKKCL